MEIDFGVAYIKENSDKRIKVTMNKFRGKVYIHIREYGFDGDDGTIFPTPKGIALDPKGLDSVIELLTEASTILGEEYQNIGQYSFNFEEETE
jgi:hypothetical protein